MKKTFSFIGDAELFDAANASDEVVEQRIAPYCDAKQIDIRGNVVTQHFTRDSAEKIADAFNSSLRRLIEKMPWAQASLPCYNGHPDHAQANEAADTTVYARVESLDAREDGLWAQIRKFPALEKLKTAMGRLEISPRWLCEPTANGVIVPFKLISLGLVKKGNLPNADVINEDFLSTEKKNKMNEEQIKRISEILGLTPAQAADPEAIITAVSVLKSKAEPPEKRVDAENETEPEKEEKPEDAIPEEKKPEDEKNSCGMSEEEKKVAANSAAAVAFAIEQKLNSAVANGKITLAQRAGFKTLLEADFVNASAVIDALPQGLNRQAGAAEQAASIDAANRAKELEARGNASREFFDLVNAMIADAKTKGETIDSAEACRRVRETDKGRELYRAANRQF